MTWSIIINNTQYNTIQYDCIYQYRCVHVHIIRCPGCDDFLQFVHQGKQGFRTGYVIRRNLQCESFLTMTRR